MESIHLSSSKYMKDVIKQERRKVRQARSRQAMRTLITFLIGLAGIYVGVLAARNIDLWQPYAEEVVSAIEFLWPRFSAEIP